ncbi:SRPBCC family protein [Amycolatopsis sp. FDAARGOS 1241]|uniref:SRPBCC family protein n=1 Tax=Amycolatopsis sp. FDAARGOS 1241 TaxID=2778070 RepID=UPI00194FF6EC|nr:SRPBCC family protein [Amycolatopsis sp. FDAARGOS 1241]QRP49698.1 SRPBCC family protein [Amycolatopsis sp. FDAARGOS 1241]
MTEFEGRRRMAGSAAHVYSVAADTRQLDAWLPGRAVVHEGEPPGLDVDVHSPDGADRPPVVLTAQRDRLRLEWGRRTDVHRGWLQVTSAGDDSSLATLNVAFPGAAEDVQSTVEESLRRLANLVTGNG